jgi:hypothetical protein
MPTLLRDLITIPEHVSKGDFVLKLADKFPLVVPPIFDKSTLLTHESLQGMWFTGTNALNEAQQVYIVGYSMPPSDRAMVHFLQEAIHPGARVEVVSKDPELYKRFRDTLPVMDSIVSNKFAGEDAVQRLAKHLASGIDGNR